MKILHVTSEVAPFSKTGGLADVLGALPSALALLPEISSVTVITPLYGCIDVKKHGLTKLAKSFYVSLGSHLFFTQVWQGFLPNQVPVYFIDHPIFSQRLGIYGPSEHPEQAYADNALRFALLSQAALTVAHEFSLAPDILHCHDWQTALTLYYFHLLPKKSCRTIFTIHNLAFLGLFPLEQMPVLGIKTLDLQPNGIEFYGQASFLKAGLLYADQITTVSPTYNQEIQTPEFGFGLDGILRQFSAKLSGILNGIDEKLWNPLFDPYLKPSVPLSTSKPPMKEFLIWKAHCKTTLQKQVGLSVYPSVPLCATISRLTYQKGIDLICHAFEQEPRLAPRLQYVVLGQGEKSLQDRLLQLANRYPNQIKVILGYHEDLAHLITAGADLYMMPSRFEPCGLNQMYSLAYGTIPVVRATGGLKDSVIPYDSYRQKGTGFVFLNADTESLSQAWNEALATYRQDPKAWHGLMERALQQEMGWSHQAKKYSQLYQKNLANP